MTKMKSTKRAMMMSALSLIVCVSMLIGSTFAWFTDTVTSGGNIIQSGKLKVDLVDENGKSLDGKTIDFVTADDRDNDEILWEPGCTYKTIPVYVKNLGNLALKYNIVINGIKGDAKLLEVIEWSVTINGEATDLSNYVGHLTADEPLSGAIVLTGHMKEDAGNDYQNLTVDGVSITVQATQDTVEYDSFDNQYDADASDFLKYVSAGSENELLNALNSGAPASLSSNITLSSAYAAKSGQNIVINGNGNTLSSAAGNTRVINVQEVNDVSLKLDNVTIDAADKERGVSVYTTNNVSVAVNRSKVIAEKYALNIANSNTNVKLNVADSIIQGWCAFQSYSAGAVINVENSTLIGLNQFPQTAPNNFATIVINPNAKNNTITIKGSRIEANSIAGSVQYFASIRDTGVTMVFENCTFFKDGKELTNVDEIASWFQFSSNDIYNSTSLTINGVQIK